MTGTPTTPKPGSNWLAGHKKEAGLGGAAAVVALLALRARKNAAGSSTGLPGATSTTGSGVGIAGLSGTPDTTLTDLQNTLQDQLNSELGTFQSNVEQQISAIPSGPAGPPGPAGKSAGGPIAPAPAPRPGYFKIRGKFNAQRSLRDIARDQLPASQQGNPNAVEAMLRSIVAANPGLKGKKTALGGHKLNAPPAAPAPRPALAKYGGLPVKPGGAVPL